VSAPTRPDAATWTRWGIDPRWSRIVSVDGPDGPHEWHLLDTGAPASHDGRTILCVHGNPTWGYAWATFLRRLAPTHRVIAIDQLGMGFSDRVPPRRYAERVRDLGSLIDELRVAGPGSGLVVAAHDWGGAIAMGWAADHPGDLDGMVLCNTGIAVPEGRSAPRLIQLAASGPLHRLVCAQTPTFVEGTVRLSRGALDPNDREAFRAPYRSRADRSAIADFVADVPLRPGHPSEAALADVAGRLPSLDVPILLAWGAADPVFDDDFAADLANRLPNTSLHRFPSANHLVMAEADVASVVELWLRDLDAIGATPESTPSETASGDFRPLWAAVGERVGEGDLDEVALVDMSSGRSSTWQQLHHRIDGLAAELIDRGLRTGDRVAVLTPPGVEQIALVYAIWRAGGVTVLADRGLGLRGLGRAVRSARVRWAVGPRPARAAARVLRWGPKATFVDVDELVVAADRRTSDGVVGLVTIEPSPAGEAAVLFTSGATGPAKGVRYSHAQLAAQRDALASCYGITSDDTLVAAFAPFALYGPALGIGTALPDCDVTAPGSLTAAALDAAIASVGASLVFASPAALTNVVATAAGHLAGLARVRTVMSAGAPVPSELLRQIAALAPEATLHTPYGMTEILPVADVTLDVIDAAEQDSPAAGVCVGHPVAGAEVRVVPLGFDAAEGVPSAVDTGRFGELLVRAPWRSDGYLGLWDTQRRARPGDGWHRSGDVGHLDDEGRLWVEGRAVHVLHTVDGPIASVPIERAVEAGGIDGVRPGRVAAVGVGPTGLQQVVIVLEIAGTKRGLAADELAAAVRRSVPFAVAAVLVTSGLPVDIRHNAKIDRAEVAKWASKLLAGVGAPDGKD